MPSGQSQQAIFSGAALAPRNIFSEHHAELDSLLAEIMSDSDFQLPLVGGRQINHSDGGELTSDAAASRRRCMQRLASKRQQAFQQKRSQSDDSGLQMKRSRGAPGEPRSCRACGHPLKDCKSRHSTPLGCMGFNCKKCGQLADATHNNRGCSRQAHDESNDEDL